MAHAPSEQVDRTGDPSQVDRLVADLQRPGDGLGVLEPRLEGSGPRYMRRVVDMRKQLRRAPFNLPGSPRSGATWSKPALATMMSSLPNRSSAASAVPRLPARVVRSAANIVAARVQVDAKDVDAVLFEPGR